MSDRTYIDEHKYEPSRYASWVSPFRGDFPDRCVRIDTFSCPVQVWLAAMAGNFWRANPAGPINWTGSCRPALDSLYGPGSIPWGPRAVEAASPGDAYTVVVNIEEPLMHVRLARVLRDAAFAKTGLADLECGCSERIHPLKVCLADQESFSQLTAVLGRIHAMTSPYNRRRLRWLHGFDKLVQLHGCTTLEVPYVA